MPIVTKMTGFNQAMNEIKRNLQNTFNTKIEEVIKDYLEAQLSAQVDANAKPMPKKAPATIKEYAKQGWNTDKFLIRTGDSTKLKITKSGNKMIVEPEGADVLKNLIPRRVEWMSLNDEAVKQITNKFLEELKKEFKP